MNYRLMKHVPEFALSGLVLGISLLIQGLAFGMIEFNEFGLWLLR
ncbi:hypothetical protein [Shewanella zhuhaiensis]|nr:hypothetical protein [Shewanella zhuhaiensis]